MNHQKNRELAAQLRQLSVALEPYFEEHPVPAVMAVGCLDEAAKRLEFWSDPLLEQLTSHGLACVGVPRYCPDTGELHLFLRREDHAEFERTARAEREQTGHGGSTAFLLRAVIVHCTEPVPIITLEPLP